MKRRRKSLAVAINPLVVDLSHHNDVADFSAVKASLGSSTRRPRVSALPISSMPIGAMQCSKPPVNLGAFGQVLGSLTDYNLASADEDDLGVLRKNRAKSSRLHCRD